MKQAPDPLWFALINEFARDTPWLQPVMIGYADDGIVVFAALLLAGWWIARGSGDLNLLAAAMAFTRVYITAEYIRDVLAGLTLGAAIGGAGFGAARPGLRWLLVRSEQSRLVRPLLAAADPIERASR